MRAIRNITILALAAACILPSSAGARAIDMDGDPAITAAPKLATKLECVPYARTTSGIQIYGDAWTWWDQAKGRYATGRAPRVGAVMAIKPFNNSKLGHVATVSRVVDSRTVQISHANWSVPGGIERNVTALDVSPQNDWTQVRIWYGPSQGLGTTHWPVSGFIYNAKPGAKLRDLAETRLASVDSGADRPAPIRFKKKGRKSDPIGDIIAGNF